MPRGVSASGPGRPPKLSADEMIVITRLSAQGRSLRTIARMLTTPERRISAETIGRWLRAARTPSDAVHMALASQRMVAVEAWSQAMTRGARDGRHAPAKDLLIATGTIRQDAADRLVVVIGNGTPDLRSLPSLPSRPALEPHDTPGKLHASTPAKALRVVSTPD